MPLEPQDDPRVDVLVVPYYFYLSYENFRVLIEAFRGRRVDARMLCMHFNACEERDRFDAARLERDGVPGLELPLELTGMGVPGAWAKLVKFFYYARNRLRIRAFLRRWKPRLVAVESDLGGIYIRTLLAECRRLGIPTAITMTLDVGQAVAPGFYPSRAQRAWNATLRCSSWLYALFFHAETVGSFAREAAIFAPSGAVHQRLVSGGIDPARIQVLGTPQQDLVWRLRNRDQEGLKRRWLGARGLPPDTRVVVFCTEVIEEVLGTDYVRNFHPLLAEAFAKLPADCRVVLRFHPRERADHLAFFRETFQGERYLEASDQQLDDMLFLADLAVGHFSTVLLRALALGTPILSVNLDRRENTALFTADQRLPQICAPEELDKIPDFFLAPGNRSALISFLGSWSAKHFPDLDGRRSQEIAERLASIMGKCVD